MMSGRTRFIAVTTALIIAGPTAAFAADVMPSPLYPVGAPALSNSQTLPQPAKPPVSNVMPVSPAPAAPLERLTCRSGDLTDFQKYLCRSAGLALPLFGQSIFARQSAFLPTESSPVGPDYVLGPGDQFGVRIWGSIDADLQLVIDRNGTVFIPKVGNINLAGVPYGMLRQQISNAVGRVYRNFDVSVNMGQLRMLPIFVTGQATNPGSYTLNPLSTLVTALFAAGGPSAAGSMRDIQIKRGGQIVAHFDLYDLLLKGDKSHDILLQPGDVLHIPAANPQVAIYGSIKVPGIYEVNPIRVIDVPRPSSNCSAA
ncbi:protein involved in polysaccharide export with SLBB domain [Silvimonas terrae]|uniref:Protein involved in polysaccharide export with SLBB domain n=1 Tax=Silvimonas terrae TaxID=300266 RepID=A0A840RLX6_9NEIS|nr:polysaccharide biosynthesis/export family protein [Silvimonas terrae]MBB5193111.1 protein involved in polysaccharide export with SLBB domain [Silvimonas terrae]